MEPLTDLLLFLAKALIVVIAIVAAVAGAAGAAMRVRRQRPPGRLVVKSLNGRYRQMERTVRAAMLPARAFRRMLRRERRNQKRQGSELRRNLFVIDFSGDLRASATAALREEISAILSAARPGDEVVLRLESVGGSVVGYGLAASQLARLKARELRLTACVDRVAASGGYLMAAVADRVLAAPFAVVGSIGVIAQFPNFNKLLKRHDIDYEQFQAGQWKRTVTLFGENTEEARSKLREQLEVIHAHFKQFVAAHRPDLDLERVATGEYWLGTDALDLKLVDELRTSDDYLLAAAAEADLYEVQYLLPRPRRWPWG